MILLDTDHLTVATDERDPRHGSLRARMLAATDSMGCTIVSVEELLRGWLAAIHRRREVHDQLTAYEHLAQLLDVLSRWTIVRFDDRAADEFVALRRERVRIGSMDLKIASMALVNDALLLTANSRDFSLVPGLRCENWLQ